MCNCFWEKGHLELQFLECQKQNFNLNPAKVGTKRGTSSLSASQQESAISSVVGILA